MVSGSFTPKSKLWQYRAYLYCIIDKLKSRKKDTLNFVDEWAVRSMNEGITSQCLLNQLPKTHFRYMGSASVL